METFGWAVGEAAGHWIRTGDNLAVLRGMNDACIDLIYLDPPFNSNRHYEAPIGSEAAGARIRQNISADSGE